MATPSIPKPEKYTDEVTTIVPTTHKSWPGSSERATEKGTKSK